MKYAIIQVVNGNYKVVAEGFTNVNNAKVNFHGLCQAMWNAQDVITADVAIVDENLDVVEGYKEHIFHEPQPTTEPEELSEEPLE